MAFTFKNGEKILTRTEADCYLYSDITAIEQSGFVDINPRPKYADGVPAYTKSLNHRVRSYDLSTGEFPITTLRPIAWKTAIKEILWIYQDASNSLDLLHNKYNVFYWDEWPSEDMPGTIGARYGEVVRRYNLMGNLLQDIEDVDESKAEIVLNKLNKKDREELKKLKQYDDFHTEEYKDKGWDKSIEDLEKMGAKNPFFIYSDEKKELPDFVEERLRTFFKKIREE